MFSFWFGKLIGKDIREYGDKNPGSANALKAGGWKIGVPAMLLDFLKGAIPLAIIKHHLALDYWLVPIAIAPVIGHAFSPFLKFKGGKAIATSFGVWTALTQWRVPIILGAAFLFGKFILKIKNDAWTAIFGFIIATLAVIILFRNIELTIISILNLIVISYKHFPDLNIKKA